MKYRLRGVYRALPFRYLVKNATGYIASQVTTLRDPQILQLLFPLVYVVLLRIH